MNRLNAMGQAIWQIAMDCEGDHELQEKWMAKAVDVQRIAWAIRKPARAIGGLEFI